NKEEATRLFKLVGEKPLILLLGGSQGSSRLNDMFLETAEEMLKRFEVVHQTGESNFEQVKKEAGLVVSSDGMKFYHPVPFVKEPELRHLYAAADFIVNRAGAGSIFEISALKKPSILIPLPEAAQNHQAENAYEYANTGAAIVMEEMNLTPHFFLEKLIYLFDNPKELEKMSRAAASFAKPEAAQVMARTIVEYLVGR
ncbi:MAG: glycosyltransferase, partial [Candidatus Pacearchaeota archaeon]|nr:glycosyltransferase [Candidatus Pacearchaeota archaeon]